MNNLPIGTITVPLFSIVIPAYNAEALVCDALDSVANQTFTDYEVIVVDDGSIDRTYDKLTLWSEQHPSVRSKIVRQANMGIGGARNTGIKYANGLFVAFLDADDIWLEQKLEFVANYIKAHPLADLVCHDIWFQSNRTGRKPMTFGPYNTYKELLFKDNSISTSATVVRRQKILDVNGFSEDMRFNGVEDYDLWLRLAQAGCRIEYFHKILSVYRDLGNSISKNISSHIQHIINVYDVHFQRWRQKNLYYCYLDRRRRGTVFRSGGHAFLRHGNYSEAQKYLWLALKQDSFNWKTWAIILLNIVMISKNGFKLRKVSS